MARYKKPAPPATGRAAVSYSRVSTQRQVSEGVSLDLQKERLQAHCKAQGWKFKTLHTDEGVSGKRARNRPGLEAALQEVCDSKGVLVVYSLSRLARSAGDAERICERLREAGADLVSVTEPIDTTSAIGRAFFGIVTVIARLESDLAGERLAAANAYTVAELGYRTQGPQPMGYKLEGRDRVKDPVETAIIDRIITDRRRGYRLREIADRLNDEGIEPMCTRRGYAKSGQRKWYAGTVYHLLRRHAPDLCRMFPRPVFLWTDAKRKILGTMTDKAAAQKLKTSHAVATRERLRLGKPAFCQQNSPRRGKDAKPQEG